MVQRGASPAIEILVFLGIALPVVLIAQYASFEPLLYSADWSLVPPDATLSTYGHHLPWPLQLAVVDVVRRVAGDDPSGYYVALTAIQLAMGCLLFLIVRAFGGADRRAFPILVALLFLVYPSDYTRTWIAVLPIHAAGLFALSYAYGLLRFTRGSALGYVVAIPSLILSLAMYEAQLGLVAAWPVVLLCARWRQLGRARKLALAVPLVTVAAFVLWRVSAFEGAVSKHDFLAIGAVTPWKIPARAIVGAWISLVDAWLATIEALVPDAARPTALAVAIALMALVFTAVWQWAKVRGNGREDAGRRKAMATTYVMALFVGGALLVAGYLPTILKYTPVLGKSLSRMNFFASPGAAVVVSSVIALAGLRIGRATASVSRYLVAGGAVVLALGVATHMLVQRNGANAWKEQRKIYRALIDEAPAFEKGTLVILVLEGYRDDYRPRRHWRRPPINGFWSVTEAVRYFYGEPTLSGDVLYADFRWAPQPRMTTEGVENEADGSVTPYSQVVAFRYDRESEEMEALGSLRSFPLGKDRILPRPAASRGRTRILD